MLWWKVSSAPVASLLKEQGKKFPPQCHRSPRSLGVTEKYTIITDILNAAAHLQPEVCKSSQDLFKHSTNRNHNYLQNHINSISTWSLSNHQRSTNLLNIRSVVVTTFNWPPVHGIFVAAVWCYNAGMVFALALEWARRCLKKALDGKPCTIETQILHKNVSDIV